MVQPYLIPELAFSRRPLVMRRERSLSFEPDFDVDVDSEAEAGEQERLATRRAERIKKERVREQGRIRQQRKRERDRATKKAQIEKRVHGPNSPRASPKVMDRRPQHPPEHGRREDHRDVFPLGAASISLCTSTGPSTSTSTSTSKSTTASALASAERSFRFDVSLTPPLPPPPTERSKLWNPGDGVNGPNRSWTITAPEIEWTREEDEILIQLMEEVLKDHIWGRARVDGRLKRTGWGVQAQAMLLLRQGTGKICLAPIRNA